MTTITELAEEINKIKVRNKRVETEKAWETSWTRTIMIAILTYAVVAIFFIGAKSADPFGDAVVPSIAFLLSTVSAPFVKRFWLKYVFKNH